MPQVPQFAGSLLRSAQAVPQVTFPVGHAHTPEVHTWPAPQTLPQVPQLVSSALVSVQVPGDVAVAPQIVALPVGQAQVPLLHAAPAAQALPHSPQFAVSEARSTQLVPQVTLPVGHAQTPDVQT